MWELLGNAAVKSLTLSNFFGASLGIFLGSLLGAIPGLNGTMAIALLLNHAETNASTTAERSLLNRLEGGCRVPIAALGVVDGDELLLDALIAHPETGEIIRQQMHGTIDDAATLGRALADQLHKDGGAAILDWVRSHQ